MVAARSMDALDRVVLDVRSDGGEADTVALDLAAPASIRAVIDHAFNNGAVLQQPGPLDSTTTTTSTSTSRSTSVGAGLR